LGFGSGYRLLSISWFPELLGKAFALLSPRQQTFPKALDLLSTCLIDLPVWLCAPLSTCPIGLGLSNRLVL